MQLGIISFNYLFSKCLILSDKQSRTEIYFLVMVETKAAYFHRLYANACHSRVMNHILNFVFVFCFLFFSI